jgi:hypothetical protein
VGKSNKFIRENVVYEEGFCEKARLGTVARAMTDQFAVGFAMPGRIDL